MNMRSDKIINTGAVLGLYTYSLLAFDPLTFLFANVLLIMWFVDRIHDARARDAMSKPAPVQEWVVYDDSPVPQSTIVNATTAEEAIGKVAMNVFGMYAKPLNPQ